MPMVENQHAARFTEVTSACCQQGFYSLSSSTFKIQSKSIQELSPLTTLGDNSLSTEYLTILYSSSKKSSKQFNLPQKIVTRKCSLFNSNVFDCVKVACIHPGM